MVVAPTVEVGAGVVVVGPTNIDVVVGFETLEESPILRSVTGGTGAYARARGEHQQTFIGYGDVFNVRTSNIIDTR